MLRKTFTSVAIVDDDDSVRTALRRLLQASGFSVETFSGGGEFLAALREIRPDCLLTDLNMPEISGLELLALIAKTGANVPVIVITGSHSTPLEESALRGGAAAVLHKPIEHRLLLDTISTVLSR